MDEQIAKRITDEGFSVRIARAGGRHIIALRHGDGGGIVREVTLTGIVFEPAHLAIGAGDTAGWVRQDGFHKMVSSMNGIPDGVSTTTPGPKNTGSLSNRGKPARSVGRICIRNSTANPRPDKQCAKHETFR